MASGRVLVTGGAGFIGRHLCRVLSAQGARVEAWTRPESAASLASLPGVEVYPVDVRRRDAVAAALAARPPERVFHLAGMRLMGNSAGNLAAMFETNVQGAFHVIESLPAETRVVMVGSGEEYGRGAVPFREEQEAQARTAYAVSRLATTIGCLALATPRICVARLAVVYGPGQTGEMFIPSLAEACARRRPFEMSTGEQTRDFIYVEDAVQGLLALSGSEASWGQVVNVATGVERTVRDVADIVARLGGPDVDLRVGAIPSRPGEASRYVCAIDKVKRLTGWQPRVNLEEGLGRTLEWWRQQVAG